MKFNPAGNAITNLGGEEFKIKSSAKAFKILSDNLYSDKIKAVVREISVNAVDAHRAANIPNRPIKVDIIKDPIAPLFIVRDYGKGLSEEQMYNLYTVYFLSDKDQSNDFTGMLGLGSKAPFAYTNKFFITSYHENKKTKYLAFIDEGGIPRLDKLKEQSTDETGLKVEVPIRNGDYFSFLDAAVEIYKWFDVVPDVNPATVLEKIESFNEIETLMRGQIEKYNTDWKIIALNYGYYYKSIIFIQGNVAYKLTFDKLKELSATDNLGSILNNKDMDILSLVSFLIIRVPNGTFDVAPSREAISFDRVSTQNIAKIIGAIQKAIVSRVKRAVYSQPNYFRAMIKKEHFSNRIGNCFLSIKYNDLILEDKVELDHNVKILYPTGKSKVTNLIKTYDLYNCNIILARKYELSQRTAYRKAYYVAAKKFCVVIIIDWCPSKDDIKEASLPIDIFEKEDIIDLRKVSLPRKESGPRKPRAYFIYEDASYYNNIDFNDTDKFLFHPIENKISFMGVDYSLLSFKNLIMGMLNRKIIDKPVALLKPSYFKKYNISKNLEKKVASVVKELSKPSLLKSYMLAAHTTGGNRDVFMTVVAEAIENKISLSKNIIQLYNKIKQARERVQHVKRELEFLIEAKYITLPEMKNPFKDWKIGDYLYTYNIKLAPKDVIEMCLFYFERKLNK